MTKFKNTLLLILACIISASCVKQSEKKEPLIFKPEKIESPCAFSSIFEEVEYLPLETKDESLLGIIQKVKCSNDRYYFLTGFNEQKIIAFDKKNGKHKLTIDKNGRGPGEYVTVQDFYVDKSDMSIELFSRGTKKLVSYNKQGDFLKEENIQFIIRNFTKVKNDYYFEVLTEKNKKALFLMQGNGNSAQKLIDIDDYYINDINNFSQFGDTLSYGCSIYNNILHYKKDDLIHKIFYDFNESQLSTKLLKTNKNDNDLFIQKIKESKSAYNLFSIYESSEFIVSTIRFNKKIHVLVYCKKTQNIKIFRDVIDDLNGFNNVFEVNVQNMPIALDNEMLIFKIEALEFNNILNKFSENDKIPETPYMKYLNKIRANDNPILIKCKLKTF